jgi:copper(I)-binding protein
MRLTAFLLAGLIGLAGATAHAKEYKVGSLQIADPWSRATPKGTSVGAGYMKITNTGGTPDRLIGGSSNVAAGLEIHETTTEAGVAKMRPVEGGLVIQPGQTIELKPGSFHVMFVGLKKELTKGEQVKATLAFEKAGTIDVDYDVREMGGAPSQGMPMRGH